MKVRFRNHKGTPTTGQITDLEGILGVRLPDEYKNFLIVYGAGELVCNSYERIHADGYSQSLGVDAFLSPDEIISSWNNLNDDEEFIDAKIVPIAGGLSANFVGIGFDPANAGKIYVMDWDFGVTFQAESLSDFLEQIKYED